MHKVIILILCLGLLATPLIALSEDIPKLGQKKSNPKIEEAQGREAIRVANPQMTIPMPFSAEDITIYMIVDLRTGAVCYVSSAGGISCIHYTNLAHMDEIHKEFDYYKKRKKGPPHIVVIQGYKK